MKSSLFACALVALSVVACGKNEAQDDSSLNSVATAGSSTPFVLAYKYRFAACNAKQGANARASYVVDTAFKAGEITEVESRDESFHNSVEMYMRQLCANRR